MNLDRVIADWLVPFIGFVAMCVWLVILSRELRHNPIGHAPTDVRILTLATLTVVAVAIAFSSLTFPSLIGPELSRGAVVLARVALVVGGGAVLWVGRSKEAV
jgi:uncharacterized membrane protein